MEEQNENLEASEENFSTSPISAPAVSSSTPDAQIALNSPVKESKSNREVLAERLRARVLVKQQENPLSSLVLASTESSEFQDGSNDSSSNLKRENTSESNSPQKKMKMTLRSENSTENPQESSEVPAEEVEEQKKTPTSQEHVVVEGEKRKRGGFKEGTVISINNNNYIMPHYNSQRPGSNAIFGPQVVKKSLRLLGGRATAVEITEWIASKRPEYVTYFGDKKKLRYSIVGILSARAYKRTFVKEVVFERGIKRADWVLHDNVDDGIDETDGLTALLPVSEEGKCRVCSQDKDENVLLLCDFCNGGFHMYCLNPPKSVPPKGNWFCPSCVERKNKEVVTRAARAIKTTEESVKKQTSGWKTLQEAAAELDDDETHSEGEEEEVEKGEEEMRGEGDQEYSPKTTRTRQKVKRLVQDMDPSSPLPAAPLVKSNSRIKVDLPTYTEMIKDAIISMGGKATYTEITTWMNTRYGIDLSRKNKLWKNTVSNSLGSGRFERDDSDSKYFHYPARGTLSKKTSPLNSLSEDDATDHEDNAHDSKMKTRSSSRSHHSKEEPVARENPFSQKKGKIPNLRAPQKFSQKLFDPERLSYLIRKNPDNHQDYQGINYINRTYPVVPGRNLHHPGRVMSMSLSKDGSLLATASTLGTIRLWKVSDWTLIGEYSDKSDTEEYNFVLISRDNKMVLTGGRRKDPKNWDQNVEDYATQPGLIKGFQVDSGSLMYQLAGHPSEINALEEVQFNGATWLLSGGQDSGIIKWGMNSNLSAAKGKVNIAENGSSTILSISIVPNTGNKFFVASCNDSIRLYDFETEQAVQSFPGLYGYLCDSSFFVQPHEMQTKGSHESFLLTKGVELLDDNDDPVNPSSVHLRKLVLPQNGMGKAQLELVKTYQHQEYKSNNWFMKLASNGRYVLSPSSDGKIFAWNLLSQTLVAILRDSGAQEIRKILFHPKVKCLLACSDDSHIYIYDQQDKSGNDPAVASTTKKTDANKPKDVMMDLAAVSVEENPVPKEDQREKNGGEETNMEVEAPPAPEDN